MKTDTLIKYVKEQAKQNSITIADQSLEDDVRFFSDYISNY